jgi:hypothetical protein
MTGALIAYAVSNPVAVLPLAFASHFLLDSLPHYGESLKPLSAFTKRVWAVDFVVLLCVLTLLLVGSKWLLVFGAVCALLPDTAWVYRFGIREKFGKLPPERMNMLNRFHSRIQKYEFRKGIFIEVAYVGIVGYLLAQAIQL